MMVNTQNTYAQARNDYEVSGKEIHFNDGTILGGFCSAVFLLCSRSNTVLDIVMSLAARQSEATEELIADTSRCIEAMLGNGLLKEAY